MFHLHTTAENDYPHCSAIVGGEHLLLGFVFWDLVLWVRCYCRRYFHVGVCVCVYVFECLLTVVYIFPFKIFHRTIVVIVDVAFCYSI